MSGAGPLHRRAKYAVLLFMLVFVAILKPLAPGWLGAKLLRGGLTLTLLACVAVIGRSRTGLMRAGLLVLIPLGSLLFPATTMEEIPLRNALQVLFLLYATGCILVDVFSTREVTIDKLFGSVCAYLMVGICFGLAYMTIDLMAPGSFRIDGAPSLVLVPDDLSRRFSEYVYFSFITMSTAGYGDIVPIGPEARSVVIAQAVFGQFYMALMVGRLLAMHLATFQQDEA